MTVRDGTRDPNVTVVEPHHRRLKLRHGINVHRHGARKDRRRSSDHNSRRKLDTKHATSKTLSKSPRKSSKWGSDQNSSANGVPTENGLEGHMRGEEAVGFNGAKGNSSRNTGFADTVSSSPERVFHQNATGVAYGTKWVCKEKEKKSDLDATTKDKGLGAGWSVLNKGPKRMEISKSDEEDMLRLSQSSVSEEQALEEAKSDVEVTPTKRKKTHKNGVVKRPRAPKPKRRLASHICELLESKAPAPDELQTVQQLIKDSEQVRLASTVICDVDDKEAPSPEQPKKTESFRKSHASMGDEDGAEDQDHSRRDTPEKLVSSETPQNVVITVHCLDIPKHERGRKKPNQYHRERVVRVGAHPSDSKAVPASDASPREKDTLRRRNSTDETEEDSLRKKASLNTHEQCHANTHESDGLPRDEGMVNLVKPESGSVFSGSDMPKGITTDSEDSPRRRRRKSRNRREPESVRKVSPVDRPVAPVGEDGYKISKEGIDISRQLRKQMLSSWMRNSDDLARPPKPRSRAEASDVDDRLSHASIPPKTDDCADGRHQRNPVNSRRTRKDANSFGCGGIAAKREVTKVLRENKRSSNCSEKKLQDTKDRFPSSEINHIAVYEGRPSVEVEKNSARSPSTKNRLACRKKRMQAMLEGQNLTDNKLASKERKVKREKSQAIGQDLTKKGGETSASLQAFQAQERHNGKGENVLASGKQLKDGKGQEDAAPSDNARAKHELRRVATRPQAVCRTERKREARIQNIRDERNSTGRFTVGPTTAKGPNAPDVDETENDEGCLKPSGQRQDSSIEPTNYVLGQRSRASDGGAKNAREPSSKGGYLRNLDSAGLESLAGIEHLNVERPCGESEPEERKETLLRDEEFGVPGSIPGDMSSRNRLRMQKRKRWEIRETLLPLHQCRPSREQKKSLKSRVTVSSVVTDMRESPSKRRSAIMPVPLDVPAKRKGPSAVTQVRKREDMLSAEAGESPECSRGPDDDARQTDKITAEEKRSKQDSDPDLQKENGSAFAKRAPGVVSDGKSTGAKEVASLAKRLDLGYASGTRISTEQNLEDLVDPEKLEQSKHQIRRSTRSRRSRVGGARRDRSTKALDELSDNEDVKDETWVPVASSSTQQLSKASRTPKVRPQKAHHMKTRGRGRVSSGAQPEPLAIIDLTDIRDDENTVADTGGTEDDGIAESLKELQRLSLEDKTKGITERPHCKYLTPLSDEESQLAEDLTTRTKRDTKVVVIAEAGITLRGESFKRLRGTRWLDDEVLNAYVSLINSRNDAVFDEMDKEHRNGIPRTYVFNTYFFTRLCSGSSGFDYPGVKGWTKRAKVDILERDIILIPINLGNYHWVLSGIDMEHKEVMYMDSMHGPDRVDAISKLKRWVFEELRHKHGEDIAAQLNPGSWTEVTHSYRVRRVGVLPEKLEPCDATAGRIVEVPKQTDGGSCGVFTAKMADCLSLGIKVYFKQKDIRLIRRRMALDLFRGYVPL